MKFVVTINGKEFEVEVDKGAASVGTPAMKPAAAPAPVAAPAAAPVAAPAAVASAGGTKMTAPMPGTIIKVLKNVGDSVASNEPIIILEAMKMENEICAPCAGTIKEVVAIKATVNSGDVLAVIG